MKARVYRNLHKKCYSIVDIKTGRVVAHQLHVVLKNVTFKVREAGRQRVLKEKRKNVHAFVCGEFIPTNFGFPDYKPSVVYYNPYKTKKFINKQTRAQVEKAEMVLLSPNEMLAWIERE